MKKAFVLLALSLAMLPSLAAPRVIRYGGYQIGDPNSDVMINETRIPGLPSYVYDSGQQSSIELVATQVPGQKIVQWWAYSSAQNVPATQTTPAHIQYNDRKTVANSTYSFDWTYATVGYSTAYVVVDYEYIKYNLSYNANDGSGVLPPSKTPIYTNTVEISANGLARKGYTWSGWTSGLTPNVWKGGDLVTGASLGVTATYDGYNVVLSATWTPHTYTVNFDKNTDASVTGDMAPMALTYDVAANLTPNAFVRKGYNFIGWTTIKGGESSVYGDGASVCNLTSDDGGVVNLYAAWAAKKYSITYHANDGTGVEWEQTGGSYGTQIKINSMENERIGYEFGWWTDETGTKTYEAGKEYLIDPGDATVIHLYAVWTPIKYTVKFNANGGEGGEMADAIVEYDDVYEIPNCSFTKTGDEFHGWATNITNDVEFFAGDVVSNLTTKATEDGGTITFYAIWKEPRYIAFDGNGADNPDAMADDVMRFEKVETKALVPNEFKKTGYTFGGWATNATTAVAYTNCEEVISTNLWMAIGETNDLYAIWQANNYTVIFNPNGGWGSMDNQEFVYDKPQPLSRLIDGTIGSTLGFLGWATNNTGAAVFADGETVSNLTAVADGMIMLYAVWKNGELSKAMHCDNLLWVDPALGDWTTCIGAEEGYNASGSAVCAIVPGDETRDRVLKIPQEEITGGAGKLSFMYKMSSQDASLCWLSCKTNNSSPLVIIEPKTEWTQFGPIDIEEIKNVDLTFSLDTSTSGSDVYTVWIDQMKWEPEGEDKKPTVYTNTVPSAVTGLVYDGKEKTGVLAGYGYTVGYTISGNVATNAGNYEATATPDAYCVWPDGSSDAMKINWSIAKAKYDMSGVTFDGATFVVDGEPKSLQISGKLPDGVEVSYSGNGETEPGVYTVTASFTGDAVNYEPIPDMTATMTIEKQRATIPSAMFDLVYDGLAKTGVVATVGYTLSDNVATNAGNYEATATLAAWYVWDDGTSNDQKIQWSIAKAAYDMSGVMFTNATYAADGEAHSIYVSGDLPDGVEVSYSGNDATTPGTYTVTASFTGDAVNYEPIADMTATMTITRGAGPDAADLVLHPAGEPSLDAFTAEKAETYVGWLRDGSGNIAAQITVKTSAAKSGKTSKSTITVAPVGGKKYTLKTTVQPGGNPTDEFGITYGALGLAGTFEGFSVEASADVAKSKDASVKMLAGKIPVGTYTFIVETDAGTAVFSAAVDKKGKTKVQGFLGNGTKVSVSATGSLGDTYFAVPVVVSKAKVSFGFVLWIPLDGGSPVFVGAIGSSWHALRAGGAIALSNGIHAFDFEVPSFRSYIDAVGSTPVVPVGEDFTVSGAKWICAKASGKLKVVDGVLSVVANGGSSNLSGLKLTYTAKTGLVKGSFKLYYMDGGKIKSDTVTIAGAVAEGVFMGSGTVKKLGSFAVWAE